MAVAKLCDALWWRRALRVCVARAVEQQARRLGRVSRFCGLYVSDSSFARWRQQSARNRQTLEREIAAIWRELLGVAEVGTDENFFELGGHSLLLVQAQGRLQERFGPAVTLVELFKYPTVRSLAAFLGRGGPATATAPSHGRERARVRRARGRTPGDGDVAVIGMSCRFPGADDLAAQQAADGRVHSSSR